MKAIEYIDDQDSIKSLFPELLKCARLKGFAIGAQMVDDVFAWVLIYRKGPNFLCLWYRFTDDTRICEKMAEIVNTQTGISYRRIMRGFARWIARQQFPEVWTMSKAGLPIDWRFYDARLGYKTDLPEYDKIPKENQTLWRMCESQIISLYSDAMKSFPIFPPLHRDLILRLCGIHKKLAFPIEVNDRLVVEGIIWDAVFLTQNPNGKEREVYETLKVTI